MTRYDRYEARSSGVLSALAALFLVVYAAPIVWPQLPGGVARACAVANGAIWACFVADLATRLALTPHRGRWLVTHPIDVLTVALPMLRPLRVLRVFTATQTLLTRSGGLLRGGQAVVATAALLVVIGALAVLDAERGAAGATITDAPDALWWSVTTVTTVGYGDLYPVTGTGRIVASALMVIGISLVGTITATVAAWFVAQRAEDERADDERDRAHLQALLSEVSALRREVAHLRRP